MLTTISLTCVEAGPGPHDLDEILETGRDYNKQSKLKLPGVLEDAWETHDMRSMVVRDIRLNPPGTEK